MIFTDTARRSYTIRDEDWRPLRLGETEMTGYAWIPLSDDEGGGWSSYWMKIDAGAQGPMHRHDTTELIVVAQGVFTDSDGAHFRTGDVLTYAAGSSHASRSAEGCVVLVVARTGSQRID
ncbi:cupin domain-containing protein [Paraburkholderia sp.]|uniref:cupin domain-containing protein n=1 Tax=Paraburkholderia sp. TaxID=1926495 RepID=UPI002389E73C|nr:cupin domain-containing protein [Paraburkholderia sp.]MDE1179224.1 cupin domain-containing protein [Paraburkholderia sp.]